MYQLNCLRLNIGHKSPKCLGTTNTLQWKPVTLLDGSMAPLDKISFPSIWITGWWAIAALMLDHWKLWNKRGHALSCRWWPLIIFTINLLEVRLLYSSKKWESVPICTMDEHDFDEVVDCNTSGISSPMAPLFHGINETDRCTTTRWLPATLMALCSSVWARLLCHRALH